MRGLLGTATVDFDANTCITDQRTPLDVDLDRYRRSGQTARQTRRQARGVLAKYAFGKLKLLRSGNPYQNSINASTATFYSALGKGLPLDSRIAGAKGRDVIEHCVK